MLHQAHFPTATDMSLEYLTVESYQWPKPERPRRYRMEVEERRRRHREGQRRFMMRKQERLATLRQEASLVEKQFRLLYAFREERVLRQERERIDQLHRQQIQQIEQTPSPLKLSERTDAPELDVILSEVLLSL